MKVVEYECGCIGLRDFDTEETIIFRHCEYSPDEVQFYFADKDDHGERPSKDVPGPEANLWIARVRRLVEDGKRLRQIRKLMRES